MFHYLDNAATTPARPEAVQAALDQISAQDDKLNAFITVTGRRALDRAEKLQAGVRDAESPLLPARSGRPGGG